MKISNNIGVASGGGADTNIYNTSGTLGANRTIAGGGFTLDFTNSNVSFDSEIAATGIFDLDEDTGIYTEKTADEDRIRFETASTFHATGTKFLGHADDAGIEFRSFTTDNQPLLSDDSIDSTSALGRRGEFRLHRGNLDNTKGLPTDGTVPSLGAGLTGVSSLSTVGRDTRLTSVGTVISSAGVTWGGIFMQDTHKAFIGVTSTSDAYMRFKRSTGEDCYIRMSGTRIQLQENTTGAGKATGGILARDDRHFSGGGVVWRTPYTSEQLVCQVGTTTYANQVFDATLRGMKWNPAVITIGIGNTGISNTGFGVGKTTSSLSTPGASNLAGGTFCDAFDLNGGSAGNTGLSRVVVVIDIALEVITPTGESVYELKIWDNDVNLLAAQCVKRVSFNTGHTVHSVSFNFEWPTDITLGSGSLGYSQIELRIQRISGSDDIRVIDDGSRICIRRME